MTKGWEVFDPRDGVPVFATRFRFVARLICHFRRRLDYARRGDGWVGRLFFRDHDVPKPYTITTMITKTRS